MPYLIGVFIWIRPYYIYYALTYLKAEIGEENFKGKARSRGSREGCVGFPPWHFTAGSNHFYPRGFCQMNLHSEDDSMSSLIGVFNSIGGLTTFTMPYLFPSRD